MAMEHGTLSIIQQWLRKKAAADAAHHFLFALFLLSVGAVLLACSVMYQRLRHLIVDGGAELRKVDA